MIRNKERAAEELAKRAFTEADLVVQEAGRTGLP